MFCRVGQFFAHHGGYAWAVPHLFLRREVQRGWLILGRMPIFELIALSLGAAGVWLWLDSIKAREIAVRAAFRACDGDGVQLLDETVAIRALGLARNERGNLCFVRKYGFEFSDTGENRRSGWLVLRGREIEAFRLQPSRSPFPPVPQAGAAVSAGLLLGQDGQELAAGGKEKDGGGNERDGQGPFDQTGGVGLHQSARQGAGKVHSEQDDIESVQDDAEEREQDTGEQ